MAPFPAASFPISGYVPKRSMYDPLGNMNAFAQSKPQISEMPMAQPSVQLTESLEKRPVGMNGLQLNDRAVPKQLINWRDRGGFWGRVSTYYIQKHEAAATVYKSPFMAMSQQNDPGTLAERYYQSLESEQKVKIDMFRQGRLE